jgi:hypothetical protein
MWGDQRTTGTPSNLRFRLRIRRHPWRGVWITMSYIFQNETLTSRKLTRKDNSQLREDFDGDDAVMCRGFGVVAPRELHETLRCDDKDPFDPCWFNNDTTVRALLLRHFPKMKKDRAQQRSAAKWHEIICRYFKMGQTAGRIEADLKDDFDWDISVDCTIQQIHRCRRGLRPNGKPYSTRKRGRPRKNPEIASTGKIGLVVVPLSPEQVWSDANPMLSKPSEPVVIPS